MISYRLPLRLQDVDMNLQNTKYCWLIPVLSLVLLPSCGTSYLNCDTEENKQHLKEAVNRHIDEFIQANIEKSPPIARQITINSVNQFIVDVNAKKCNYRIDVTYTNSNKTVSNVPVTAVFRSSGVSGKSHTLTEFEIPPGDAVRLASEAVKSNRKK